jgi:hypothetical protein
MTAMCAKQTLSTLSGHVWMAPADQGLFSGGTLIVGAVMSSAFFCGEWKPPALMLSADPLP